MMAVAFDVDRLEFKGTPVPVQNAVSVLDGVAPLYALANDGTLIFRTGEAGSLVARYRLTWVDRLGLEAPVDSNWIFRHTEFGGNAGWSLSPDGSRVAIGLSTDEGDDIWVKQLPDGPAVRVTFDVASEFRPRWLADGRTVMFSTNREADGLYRRPADGTGADVLLLRGNVFEGQVTRDGGTLVARAGGQIGQRGGRNIGMLRLGADTVLTPLLATQYDESEIALSPDGRWLAYVSDETGQPEVVIRPFPDVDRARFQVSATGGAAPLWSRDGRELFYISGSRDMMVVSVAPGADLRLGERRKLFHLSESLYPPGREYYTPYDISPDGRRFLMARRVSGTSDGSAPLLMTLDWHEEVRARLGKK
jgi:serine/threonine-protein kinase